MASEKTKELIEAISVATTMGKMEVARDIVEDLLTDFASINQEKFEPLMKQCELISAQFDELSKTLQKTI